MFTFFILSFEICYVFYAYSTSQFRLTTFPITNLYQHIVGGYHVGQHHVDFNEVYSLHPK